MIRAEKNEHVGGTSGLSADNGQLPRIDWLVVAKQMLVLLGCSS